METIVYQPKGLRGAITRAKSSTSQVAKTGVGFFAKPELWLVRCTIVASVISVFYYAGDKAKDQWTQAILVLLGLAAVGFHYWGAKNACRSWYERQIGAFCLWLMIVVGAVSWEVNNQLLVVSNNQDNLTAVRQTSYDTSIDRKEAVNRAAGKLNDLKREKAWQAVVDPAEAIQAKIDGKKSHKWWEATEQCNKTKGPQTRAFCDEYRQAEADKVTAMRKVVLVEEVKAAEQQLEDARKANEGIKAVTSTERADFKNLKKLATLMGSGELSEDDVEFSQSLLTIMVMALFLTVAGWLIKSQEYEGLPRKPWGVAALFSAIYRWCYRQWTGENPPQPVYNVKIEGDGKGGEALDQIERFRRSVADAAIRYSQPASA